MQKVWIEAEKGLSDKVRRLEQELKRADQLNMTEALELKDALSDARDELTRLEEHSIQLKVSFLVSPLTAFFNYLLH